MEGNAVLGNHHKRFVLLSNILVSTLKSVLLRADAISGDLREGVRILESADMASQKSRAFTQPIQLDFWTQVLTKILAKIPSKYHSKKLSRCVTKMACEPQGLEVPMLQNQTRVNVKRYFGNFSQTYNRVMA